MNSQKPDIKWNRGPGELGLLARCGSWKATLGKDEIYSEGDVFIEYCYEYLKENKKLPKYLWEGNIDSKGLVRLIDGISQRMVKRLTCGRSYCKCKCKKVYLVSLNEGENGPLHLRLLPRYEHDEHFLRRIAEHGEENDGLALMADWRRQFLLRMKHGKWGTSAIPAGVSERAWEEYARKIRRIIVPRK